MKLKKLLEELKRRKVYHVALTYGVTAWLIAQVLDLVTDAFDAPPWIMKMSLIFLLVGFPIALVLAWAYELSPQGIVRTDTEEATANPYSPSQRRPLINLAIIGVLVAAVVFLLFYKTSFWGPPEREMASFHAPNSIPVAMLPFINLSEDKELGYFSSQLTNDIINELAKVRSFAVTAFSTIYGFEDQGKSPGEIAETFGVDYLMRGSARAFAGGDSIKIDIELIDPQTGRRLWGEAYEEAMGQAPALQAAIAKKVADNLNVQLSPAEAASLSGDKTRNGQAYLKFLEARQNFQSLQYNGLKKAEQLLEEVLFLDPNYTEAHTLLAWLLTLYSWPSFRVDQARLETNKQRIEGHLATAMLQNPNSSDIYLVKANYSLSYLDDLEAARDNVEKALEINSWPELPTTGCICTAVTVNVVKGNLERAKEIADVARRVEPGNIMIINDAFFMNLVEGELEAAARDMENAKQLMDVPVFRFQTGWVYYLLGRYQEAISLINSAYEGFDYTPPAMHAYLSNAYYKLGDLQKSNAYRDTLTARLAAGETHVLADLATIAAERGEDKAVLELLERHQREAIVSLSYQINVDPIFDRFEDLPRFRALRERMGYYK
jgi:TolB-like protein